MTNNNQYDTSKASWLTQGLEELLADNATPDFDVVVIGSGYGGAIAASVLAGREFGGNQISLCVLERGNEFLPGMFPHGLAELPGQVRIDQNKEGLFDVRFGADVCTLVANGVGGGSLINAGVMEVPRDDVFTQGWPADLANLGTWQNHYDEARELLGASNAGVANSIDQHPDGIPTKTTAFEDLANPANTFRYAALTVAMEDSVSPGNVNLNKCLQCGDCATGCNFGAKISLDVGLLADAHAKGAKICSGATVLSLKKNNDDVWEIKTVHTNATLRERLQGPGTGGAATIKANKVILAAGTLGSTEILSRSKPDVALSSELGKHCSTNGDMLVTDYETRDWVNTVANENVRPSDRTIGPTITGVVDLRETHGVLIEEMSVPAGIRRLFGEVFATTFALHRLNKADHSTHGNGYFASDLYSAWDARIDKSALYAVMGNDGALGEIELPDDIGDQDGVAKIKWDKVQELDLFENQVGAVAELTEETDGKVIANPLWNLMPDEMSFLLDNRRGPVVTVHPLGGCIMADSHTNGVVDAIGRVYDTNTSKSCHDGLVVLDGSIVPTALGTNPALTIAAIALRASRALANEWNYTTTPPSTSPALDRPVARDTDYAFEPEGTTHVQVCERMHGPARLRDTNGTEHDCVVELTLRTAETPVSVLTYADEANPAEIQVDGTQDGAVTASRVRIYHKTDWDDFQLRHVPDSAVDDLLDAMAVYRAPIDSGTLNVFERRESSQFSRFWQAGPAYLGNRGWRDIYQAVQKYFSGGGSGGGLWQRVIGFFRLASRAGEQRWLRYNLQLGPPDNTTSLFLAGNEIVGRKLFTYDRRCNPWRQLMQMRLQQFPGIVGDERNVELDLNHLVRIGIPLFRVTKQADGVTALAELGSFASYLLRLMLGIHIWTFRKPDEDPNPVAAPSLLPTAVTDIPVAPTTAVIPMGAEVPDGADNGSAVSGEVRLTCFRNSQATKAPILMLHGYSAGGTTFAHHSVSDGLASQFWHDGREVWVADLRSSSGQPDTAEHPWSMEQIAYRDIPAAVDYIVQDSGKPNLKIDVLAHCMGAVMFSMAILRDEDEVAQRGYAQDVEARLDELPDHIRKVAFSQVGPLVVFSPTNRLRAYAAQYLNGLVPGNYQFVPDDPDSLADQMLDRVLSSLPYPVEEFDYENPTAFWKRTPWTRTRHRMDALYGRDFNVRNVDETMLRHIDEHFGRLSIGTVTQTIHFARHSTITDREGYNSFVSRSSLGDDNRWHFPAISVHGRDNGLADVTTVDRMEQMLVDAGRVYERHVIQGAGHQDALIGAGRFEMANKMMSFFDAVHPTADDGNDAFIAVVPWIGPLITSTVANPAQPIFRVGASPLLREPIAIVMLPVQVIDNEFRRHSDGLPFDAGDADFIAANIIVVISSSFTETRWGSFPLPLPPTAVPPGSDGLLTLIIYEEAETLPNAEVDAMFGLEPDLGGIYEIDPETWKPKVTAMPDDAPDSTSDDDALAELLGPMLKISRATLGTLLNQRGVANTNIEVPLDAARSGTLPDGYPPIEPDPPAVDPNDPNIPDPIE